MQCHAECVASSVHIQQCIVHIRCDMTRHCRCDVLDSYDCDECSRKIPRGMQRLDATSINFTHCSQWSTRHVCVCCTDLCNVCRVVLLRPMDCVCVVVGLVASALLCVFLLLRLFFFARDEIRRPPNSKDQKCLGSRTLRRQNTRHERRTRKSTQKGTGNMMRAFAR